MRWKISSRCLTLWCRKIRRLTCFRSTFIQLAKLCLMVLWDKIHFQAATKDFWWKKTKSNLKKMTNWVVDFEEQYRINRVSQNRFTHMIFYFFLNPEQIMLYYVLFFLKVKEQVHIPNVATTMEILKRYLRGTCLHTTETLSRTEFICQALFSECYYERVSVWIIEFHSNLFFSLQLILKKFTGNRIKFVERTFYFPN